MTTLVIIFINIFEGEKINLFKISSMPISRWYFVYSIFITRHNIIPMENSNLVRKQFNKLLQNMDASITASNCEERSSQSLAGNVSVMTTQGIKPPKIIQACLQVTPSTKVSLSSPGDATEEPQSSRRVERQQHHNLMDDLHLHWGEPALASQYVVPTEFPLIRCWSRPLVRRVQLALKYPNSFWFHNACSALFKFCNKIVFSMGHKIGDLWKLTAI